MAPLPQPPTRKSGAGEIIAQSHGPQKSASRVSKIHSSYPLRLISPRPPPESQAVMVFMLTFGGGLVAGDQTNLSVKVQENARLGLLTQGSTRAYKSPSLDVVTKQTLHVKIEAGSALLLLPDPVQPFKDSVFEQRQTFEIDPALSSLLLLDWVSEGRSSRGEAWQFASWRSRNEIWSLPSSSDCNASSEKKRLLLRDNIKLDSRSSPPLLERMEGLGVFGTLIITGPLFKSLGTFFLDTFKHRPRIGEKIWSQPESADQPFDNKPSPDGIHTPQQQSHEETGLNWTATEIRGFVIVKFGAKAIQHARRWLREMLVQEGTVEAEFGSAYLYCLQDR